MTHQKEPLDEKAFALVSDYVDSELSPDQARELEEELARSPAMRSLLEDLRGLRSQTCQLPRNVEPARDLWPEIERSVQGRDGTREAHAEPGWLRRFTTWMCRPAPGLALAGAAAATAFVLFGGDVDSPEPASLAIRVPDHEASEPVEVEPSRAFQTVLPHESEYLAALELLSDAYSLRRGRLETETLATFDENLGTIDAAIESSRGALLADPDSEDLKMALDHVYQQKIELLRAATELQESAT
jgi:anti-sigma factor RsiW